MSQTGFTGDSGGQAAVERKAQAVTDHRLMHRRKAVGQSDRRRLIEHLTELELFEIWSLGIHSETPLFSSVLRAATAIASSII